MKRSVAVVLVLLMVLTLIGCNDNTTEPLEVTENTTTEIESETLPEPDVEQEYPVKTTPCTEAEISEVISAGDSTLSVYRCEYLLLNQKNLPEDLLNCLNEHLGEYRVYKLSGAAGELEPNEEPTDEEIEKFAAILQLHGYTEDMLVSLTLGDVDQLSPSELEAKVAENKQYMVDGKTAYKMPEDGEDFLPYFSTFEPEILDEALGVTLSAPREITDTTIYSQYVDLSVSLTRCALITNNSNKTVQLISADDLTESDWKKVEGYDTSLLINWTEVYDVLADGETGPEDSGLNLIPLGASSVLEPGESTVVRYSYIGKNYEDFDFLSRFSYYVTDGESTELLAGVVMNHIRPSLFPESECTINGTLYDEETGLPLPGIDIQTTRSGSNYTTTDENGRFSIDVAAFQFDTTGNWARCTVFVNELGTYSSGGAQVDATYAQECIIVEPHAGESMDLTLALKKKPTQVNYTLQTQHDMKMQAYCVDVSDELVVTSPFHTTYTDDYKYENGYLHVFDKTGKVIFEKRLYGESASCDISKDGKLVASIVHGKKSGEPDSAVVWDIDGNEVFSYQVPYKKNPKLYIDNGQNSANGVSAKLGDIEISNDGKKILLATDEGHVCVVRISDKKTLCEFWGNSKMYKLFWSVDDKVVYTGTEAGDFCATEVATGKTLWKKYIEATIFGWVMNDTCVVTSTKATGVGYLICTELATGKTLWTIDTGMRCSSMCLSHDGKTLFWGTDTGSTNERCIFIDMETGTPLWGTPAGKQAAAFSANDKYVSVRSGGNLTLWTTTGEHLYGAIIADDNNSMSWGLYMSGDCKNIVSFAGGNLGTRFQGVMYALTLDDSSSLE